MEDIFENIQQKFDDSVKTQEYKDLVSSIKKSDIIIVTGNGGNYSIASHAASDLTRLTDKFFIAMDSLSYFSSVANDYGYNNIFTRWFDKIESTFAKKKNIKVFVIGLSGSGNSKNIVSSLDGARDKGWDSMLISGKRSICLPEGIPELCIECEAFHTAELISLMLFYQLVHDLGYSCPTIDKEIRRKSMAPKALRG